jgi:hypothetical protein
MALKRPQDMQRYATDIRAFRANVARQDINEFMEFVFSDDRSLAPLIQAPIHARFHRIAGKHKRAIIWSHVEAGKTTQLSVGKTLFEIGRDPNLRCAIAGSAQASAIKILHQISTMISTPGRLHEVFPHMRPGKVWTSRAITVQRTAASKDPSIQVTSVGTGAITGARIDRFIFDDILTYENTRTQANREHVRDWYGSSAISGRITEDGHVLFVGNAYHPDDLMHELSRNAAVWYSAKFPVIDQHGASTWPERWSQDRISAKRLECTPDEFARQMLCQARDDNSGRFRREWILQCMRRGEGKKLAYALAQTPFGYRVYTGVDLGVRKRAGSDLTSLFTICVHPNEDREVLCVESGRWAANEIVDKIVDTHRRFNSIIIVENNAAQQYIVDFTKQLSAVPVRPFHTGTNKYHPEFGIEGLATEISNSKWIIPSEGGHAHPEVEAWVNDLLFYDPSAHAGDRLMASWFAREGARQGTAKPRGRIGTIDTVSR